MQCLHCTREIFAPRKVVLARGWTEIILAGERYWLCPLHSVAPVQ